MLNINGKKVKYPLQAREMSGDKRMGFTNADRLYMLMPDRFASGRGITKPLKGMNPYVVDRSKPSLRHGGDLEGIRHTWIISINWASLPCGLRLFWKTMRLILPITTTIMAMIPQTIIVLTHVSEPMKTTVALLPKHMPKA